MSPDDLVAACGILKNLENVRLYLSKLPSGVKCVQSQDFDETAMSEKVLQLASITHMRLGRIEI